MNLIGEEFIPPKEEKNKKTSKLLLIAIVVVFVLIILIIVMISALKTEPLKVTLNGEESKEIKSLLVFGEGNNSISIPIKDIAPYLKYKAFNGDYNSKSEDNTKCYIEIDDEAVVYTAGSDEIEIINKKNKETYTKKIDQEVKLDNGKLYTTPDGIEKGFNLYFEYKVSEKKIIIETLEQIISEYKERMIKKGYTDIATDFINAKAALQDLVIVNDEQGKFGLYDLKNNKQILETKYDNINYIPLSNEFLISSNNKKGIIDASGKEIIKMQYDEIERLSADYDLLLIRKDGKYAIIDKQEKVLYSKLDKVGIDIKRFDKNNLKSPYILLDKYIPIMKNNKWVLITVDGELLVSTTYDSLGCINSNSTNSDYSSVLVIPDYNLIVAARDKKYYLIDEQGRELGGIAFDGVYLKTEIDKTSYYIRYGNQEAELSTVMDQLIERTKDKEE